MGLKEILIVIVEPEIKSNYIKKYNIIIFSLTVNRVNGNYKNNDRESIILEYYYLHTDSNTYFHRVLCYICYCAAFRHLSVRLLSITFQSSFGSAEFGKQLMQCAKRKKKNFQIFTRSCSLSLYPKQLLGDTNLCTWYENETYIKIIPGKKLMTSSLFFCRLSVFYRPECIFTDVSLVIIFPLKF